jgi:hypothetical protein
MQDDVLRHNVSRVQAEAAPTEGGSVATSPEHAVSIDNMHGSDDLAEAAPGSSRLLTVALLLERLNLMVLGGPGGPIASGSDQPPVEVTKELVLLAADAVRDLFSTHREQIELSCGELDEREALVNSTSGTIVNSTSAVPMVRAASSNSAARASEPSSPSVPPM